MKNHNDQAMASYFSSMLSEKPEDDLPNTRVEVAEAPVKKEQQRAHSLPETLVFSSAQEAPENTNEVDVDNEVDVEIEELKNDGGGSETKGWQPLVVDNDFQVLFFDFAGLTFAIPLTDLGGIHKLDKPLNSLFGKPDWFLGVMTHNDSLFNIVDTAKWINSGLSAQSLNYNHYVLLGSTNWGLSCEKLLGTDVLTKDQIKWRKTEGKRPWLAGMVKDKMCALLHAQELVKLLDSGANINGHG